MIQLLVLIAISWALVWLIEKKNLSVLGLTPTVDRLKYFSILLIVSALCSAAAFLLRMYFAKEEYSISSTMSPGSVVEEVWNQFRTVLTEELLCRGVLLYILIKRFGQGKAILISAIIFAALHWLNAGVWGNVMQMAIVFTFTFAMGLLLAYSYAKTFSLLIPFAIHFGWNLTQNYIFPDTHTGNHVFELALPPPIVTVSYLTLFVMLLLPKISVILFNYLVVRQYKQAEIP
ncbi:MAG: CPBP family intramembrane metalloprotease [Cyclobacteriaceae bacterium]|nr:CPBP family intramembrane metalloprotease [Cyclobacteriaceae bacterium]